MRFSALADAMARLESTSARLALAAALRDLVRDTPAEALAQVVYLVLGRLGPEWSTAEIGLADKQVHKVLATTHGVTEAAVERLLHEHGDYGSAAEALEKSGGTRQVTLESFGGKRKTLTVAEVWTVLHEIAAAAGTGSQDDKQRLLQTLLGRAEPLEARYLVRFIIGKLRLGVAEMTVLDGLAMAYGPEVVGDDDQARPDPETRARIERAFHVQPDLGLLAAALAKDGPESLDKIRCRIGIPVRPMLAERASTAAEALAETTLPALVEYKYDGLRMQIHRDGDSVRLFSRRLEDLTDQFPDVAGRVREEVRPDRIVFEAEAVAVDPSTGDLRPFQELATRRGRKHGLAEAIEEVPVRLVVFDLIHESGRDRLSDPLGQRRQRLEEILGDGTWIVPTTGRVVEEPKEADEFFDAAVAAGSEGIMVKRLDAPYQAGARGWNWVKVKRDYQHDLADTLDLVLIGALQGRGRRAGRYGAFIMAAYDPARNRFPTVCRVGTGLTDEDLQKFTDLLRPKAADRPDPRIESTQEADAWFPPEVVLEIQGQELSLSPVHTAGAQQLGKGIAVRFPRFTGRIRDDKGPSEATTVDELVELWERRRQRPGPAGEGERNG